MDHETMAVSIKSHKPFRPWPLQDPHPSLEKGDVDLSKTILRAYTTLNNRVSPSTCHSKARGLSETPSGSASSTSSLSGLTSPKDISSSPSTTAEAPPTSIFGDLSPSFTFTPVTTPLSNTFTFPVIQNQPFRGTCCKRRRASHDVDGPNTGSLGSKKRRLLRYLITSRLSQPFSMPATNILNREAIASGDKRFLKFAAIMGARKIAAHHTPPFHHLHFDASEMLRRAAIINRFRLRMLVQAEQRGDNRVAAVAASASLLHLSSGLGPVGSRFPVPAGGDGAATHLAVRTPPFRYPPRLPPPVPPQDQPHPLSRAAVVARSSPPGSPDALRPADRVRTKQMVPSPQLVPARERALVGNEILDDDECSFPASDLDYQYDPSDPDDVYADFGVIFGGGDGEKDGDSNEDDLEDYMDGLDGIPMLAR